jgi:hypothetical protein
MTEERKHAILFAATLLSVRKLINIIAEDKASMAKQFFVDRAIKIPGGLLTVGVLMAHSGLGLSMGRSLTEQHPH